MELLEIFGYMGALLMGIVLGLLGAGGSILTLPILFYLFGVDVVLSTAYSLFIVGFTALAGALPNMKKRLVNYRVALLFSAPSLLAVYLARAYIVPSIPQELFSIGRVAVTKDIAILVGFAIIMILAALSMMRSARKDNVEPVSESKKINYQLILIEGLVVGLITGIVGAGGGFLIIPALVLIAKLPMKMAVGTSLLIIAIKSILGFLGDVQSGQEIDWMFLIIITGITIAGILIGTRLSNFVEGAKLKKAFGWFVLLMGCYIILNELFIQSA
jgi:uncharacterized membrane protein YfcA